MADEAKVAILYMGAVDLDGNRYNIRKEISRVELEEATTPPRETIFRYIDKMVQEMKDTIASSL